MIFGLFKKAVQPLIVPPVYLPELATEPTDRGIRQAMMNKRINTEVRKRYEKELAEWKKTFG